MAMVNQLPNPTMAVPYNLANVKDSRWLTLEVCREFQRNKCSRTETECKFAHPPPNVEVQNGRVTCCFDSIKGKCQRKDPPCKYLHPPQHLREQLLQNGKNNLILRNLQMQVAQFGLQPMVPNVIPFAHHYPSPVQTAAAYPYSHLSPAAQGLPATSVHAVSVSNSDSLQAQQGQQIIYSNPATQVCREWQRATCTRSAAECRFAHPPDHVLIDCADNQVTVCMDFIKGKCCRDTCRYFHPPQHLANQIKAAQQRLAASQSMAGPETVLHESTQCLQCPGSMNPVTGQQVADAMKGKKRSLEEEMILGVPAGLPAGLMPCMKRPALADKCTGLPTMYHQAAATNNIANYHQAAALAAMQIQGPTFVPVSFGSTVQGSALVMGSQAYPSMFAAPPPSLVNVSSPPPAYPAHSVSQTCTNQAPHVGVTFRPEVQHTSLMIPIGRADISQVFQEQLPDTLPICRDFKLGQCGRPHCKYVHIREDNVEVYDGKVIVCRDYLKGKCMRASCKYFHQNPEPISNGRSPQEGM